MTTQDPVLELRLEPAVGAKRLKNYLKTVNMELTTIARACGKQDVHHLEKEDLVALTVEAAAMAGVPLGGDVVDTRRPGIEAVTGRTRQSIRRGGICSRLRPVRSEIRSSSYWISERCVAP